MEALADLRRRIADQESLRSELIAAKVKAGRAEAASTVLVGAEFERCPRCGADLDNKNPRPANSCHLCGTPEKTDAEKSPEEGEILRRELNTQIDDLADLTARHTKAATRQDRKVRLLLERKAVLDQSLADALARYDTAFVANVRAADRLVATLQERIASLKQLSRMPAAIQDLEREAGNLQGDIDIYRTGLLEERDRLRAADTRIKRLEETFLAIMRDVGYPGVYPDDRVEIDPRRWAPLVVHGEDEDIAWGFFDAGSGGKKTLFNVCYALAVHQVAIEDGLPLPTLLIIDSPTKNISRDINAALVASLYRYIFKLAATAKGKLQLILIDSDLAVPDNQMLDFRSRLMAHGDPDHPPLISYYVGP
jgi:DNA repair exonuclease SbcCD ATPase subunit